MLPICLDVDKNNQHIDPTCGVWPEMEIRF